MLENMAADMSPFSYWSDFSLLVKMIISFEFLHPFTFPCYLEYFHEAADPLDWLQSLKQFFINVSYHMLVASLTLMALFENRAIRVRLATGIMV